MILYSLFSFSSAYSFATFRKEYVSLVVHGENYLFRGSIPRDETGLFQKKLLLETLREKAAEKGVLLPEDFHLSIVSLLTCERDDETAFIRQVGFPLKRQRTYITDDIFWTWWQVRPHFHTPPKEIPLFQQEFDGEYLAFPRLIAFIKKLYLKKLRKPNVIYVHCRHGRNRTTAAIAGILMNLFHLPLTEVWAMVVVQKIYEPHELYYFLSSYEKYLQSLSKTSRQNTHQKIFLLPPLQEMTESI